ncbi:MAG: class I SAM-dependent methyltransferase [Anaerolineae bacterium]
MPISPPRGRGGAGGEVYLGRPSYVWGFGQERRFRLLLPYLAAEPGPMLDIGCGVGVYLRRFRQEGITSFGMDVEPGNLHEAVAEGLPIALAVGEALPFADEAFGTVLLHEVIEHFEDDAAALREALRVTRPGGRVFIFAPNRLYPFETHGIYLGRRYIFGNIPLVSYLPDGLRGRLCPHVRTYTVGSLRRLLVPLPCRILAHVQIFPGYDKIFRRWPYLARLVRRLTYLAERTPARAFGLSHVVVLEKG